MSRERQSHEAELRDGEGILQKEVQTLRERLKAHERRTEEIVDRQQRQIDRLEQDSAEARRP